MYTNRIKNPVSSIKYPVALLLKEE